METCKHDLGRNPYESHLDSAQTEIAIYATCKHRMVIKHCCLHGSTRGFTKTKM